MPAALRAHVLEGAEQREVVVPPVPVGQLAEHDGVVHGVHARRPRQGLAAGAGVAVAGRALWHSLRHVKRWRQTESKRTPASEGVKREDAAPGKAFKGQSSSCARCHGELPAR